MYLLLKYILVEVLGGMDRGRPIKIGGNVRAILCPAVFMNLYAVFYQDMYIGMYIGKMQQNLSATSAHSILLEYLPVLL